MKVSQPTGFGEVEGLDYPVRSPDTCELLRVHPGASELERRVGTSSRTPQIAALSIICVIVNHSIPALSLTIDQGESRR